MFREQSGCSFYSYQRSPLGPSAYGVFIEELEKTRKFGLDSLMVGDQDAGYFVVVFLGLAPSLSHYGHGVLVLIRPRISLPHGSYGPRRVNGESEYLINPRFSTI